MIHLLAQELQFVRGGTGSPSTSQPVQNKHLPLAWRQQNGKFWPYMKFMREFDVVGALYLHEGQELLVTAELH